MSSEAPQLFVHDFAACKNWRAFVVEHILHDPSDSLRLNPWQDLLALAADA